MKFLLCLFFAGILSPRLIAQTAFEKFFKALEKGDTVLARKIEQQNAHIVKPIQELKFPERNNATAVFAMPLATVKDSILSFFNLEHQFQNKILGSVFFDYMWPGDTREKNKHYMHFLAETATDTIGAFGKDYFSIHENKGDIFLHDFMTPWPSKLYHSNGKALEYNASFGVKLTSINDSVTSVSIIAYDPIVSNGIDGFSAHGPIGRVTSVAPSSIEEYTLLLFIAEQLHKTDLAPLRLPVKNK